MIGSEVTDMSASIAIIAALHREVAPLVGHWRRDSADLSQACHCFSNGTGWVFYAGMGVRSAQFAAETAIAKCRPDLLVSAGLAGALIAGLRVGQVIEPSIVIDSETGERYSAEQGENILVTAAKVAEPDAKALLARQYGAQLVDMEAAGVASVARKHGIAFTAIKAISDEVDFEMPDFTPFVDKRGNFRSGKFFAHIAVRPQMWRTVKELSSNSKKASLELCAALQRLIEERTRAIPVVQGKESNSR